MPGVVIMSHTSCGNIIQVVLDKDCPVDDILAMDGQDSQVGSTVPPKDITLTIFFCREILSFWYIILFILESTIFSQKCQKTSLTNIILKKDHPF
jgi:hypothetical protein